jgi:hypothetical protein
MTVPTEGGGDDWIWNFWWGGGPTVSAPVVAPDGTVYGVGMGAGLAALKREAPLANSTWPMFRGDPQHTGRVREKPAAGD